MVLFYTKHDILIIVKGQIYHKERLKMEFLDKMLIRDMEEGKRYPATQGNNGYSDGVWFTKHGDEMELRHFWTKEILKYDKDGYYSINEEDGVCYPKDPSSDMTEWIHKDLMQVIPDAITYRFEDMTLSDFHEIVVMGLFYMETDNYVFPKHLKGKVRRYNRNLELINEI